MVGGVKDKGRARAKAPRQRQDPQDVVKDIKKSNMARAQCEGSGR